MKHRNCRSARAHRLVACAAGLWFGLATTPVTGDDAGAPAFPGFKEWVARAQFVGGEERGRFARAAIDAMIEAYAREIGNTMTTRRASAGRAGGDGRWHAGATAYVGALRATRARLAPGAVVRLIPEPGGVVRLVIDGRQVMISGPRLSAQRSLEEQIARALNSGRYAPAASFATAGDGTAANGARHAASEPGRAPVGDGLDCGLGDYRHVKLRQAACRTLVNELRLLGEALRSFHARGMRIDWQVLDITRSAPGQPQRVIFARDRHVDLPLPGLYRCAAVWRAAIPWLRARAAGRSPAFHFEPPGDMVYLAQAR